MQVHYLDECFVILLLYRHEHADNITKQVGSALWHTVEEYGLIQPGLVELSIQLVQGITHCGDFWHRAYFRGKAQKRIPAVAGILKNLAVLMGC